MKATKARKAKNEGSSFYLRRQTLALAQKKDDLAEVVWSSTR